jgi:hypothetical protein
LKRRKHGAAGARTRDGDDVAALIARRSAQCARWLAQLRVGADPVDREAAKVGGRRDFCGVEPNHRVVKTVADNGHGADGPVVVGTLGNDWRAWSAAVTGGEPDQLAGLSWPMVVRVQLLPLTTMPAPPPSPTFSSAAAVGVRSPARSAIANPAAACQRVMCTAVLPLLCGLMRGSVKILRLDHLWR